MKPLILSTVEGACEGAPVVALAVGEYDGPPVGPPVGLIVVGEYVGPPVGICVVGESVGPFVGLIVGEKLLWVVLLGSEVSVKSNNKTSKYAISRSVLQSLLIFAANLNQFIKEPTRKYCLLRI